MAKTIFDNTVSSLDSKITENKTKNKPIDNELKKLKTLDLSYFIGKSYLVFQPIRRYFKIIQKIYIKYIYKIIQNISHHGNLKDYLTKILHLMLPLTIALLH